MGVNGMGPADEESRSNLDGTLTGAAFTPGLREIARILWILGSIDRGGTTFPTPVGNESRRAPVGL